MKQKKQLAFLAVLVVIAGIVWYFQRFQSAPSDSTVVMNSSNVLLPVDNLRLHRDRLERARETEYKGGGRNIFSSVAPPPRVVPKTNPPDYPSVP